MIRAVALARRSWWRRLLDALPRRRRALPPAVEICACGRPIDATGACWPCRWEANALDGRPPPTAPPRRREIHEQIEDLRQALGRVPPPAMPVPSDGTPSSR